MAEIVEIAEIAVVAHSLSHLCHQPWWVDVERRGREKDLFLAKKAGNIAWWGWQIQKVGIFFPISEYNNLAKSSQWSLTGCVGVWASSQRCVPRYKWDSRNDEGLGLLSNTCNWSEFQRCRDHLTSCCL